MVVSNSNLPSNILRLIVQPYDTETAGCLRKIGFQPVPRIPQLLFLSIAELSLSDIFLQISQVLSETSLAHSRFSLTRSPLSSRSLLLDFLQSQPLSSITRSMKYAWFLQVLAKRSLFFKYQPIFALASGQVVGYECLARATNQERTFSGQQLVDAALATDLGCEFDELARTTCLESISNLLTPALPGNTEPTFFINILPNAIIHAPQSLRQNFQRILELGLNPQQIVFELTEVQALSHNSDLLETLTWVRDQGFRLAIDDFCGFVSIDHYFTALHPDVIKLDRRLIHDCSNQPMKQLLIKSLLHSAHEMAITVLAEGLEDREDIAFCREVGVDLGQGFGLALPDISLWQQPLNVVEFSLISKAS